MDRLLPKQMKRNRRAEVLIVPVVMLLLGMISTIVIVTFALQNGQVVTVGFFDWRVEASLVLVIIVSALMGFLAALFFELFIQIKLRYRLYKLGRQIKQQDEEIQRLKKETGLAPVSATKQPSEEQRAVADAAKRDL
jgi:uncharacterized integral membrane protein